MIYAVEEFNDEEQDILRPYFSNLDQPVFALVNLPEVVKGALFARYSRSDKSLRRLFLDEFVGDLDVSGDMSIDASIGLARAEQLYDRVFLEYGDDSVAQLGGVHLACEQSSNLLTKILEWGRLMSYLEQSTRYVPYDTTLSGRFRYYRPPHVLSSPLGARYVATMDGFFDSYRSMLPTMFEWAKQRYPKDAGDSDFVYKSVRKYVDEHGAPVGIYNVAAGNLGIARALDDSGLKGKVLFIGHELNPNSRMLLETGAMDFAIGHDLDVEVARSIGTLESFFKGAPPAPVPLTPVRVFTKYSCRH